LEPNGSGWGYIRHHVVFGDYTLKIPQIITESRYMTNMLVEYTLSAIAK